ncbi:MAG: hypothetical protein A2015_09615 [Spirochaetes bacterium GWF1_31_7]|nr:MAG: hypothetical protein A2Y30_00880 [Spirochaetes bacterium GWE1_32_154]OHD45966.1 MAG: hypothetical protein A2Y29_16725 [Spirochaetes bacterium GWE2_31_10]OHD52620.1 MAG: hypothetical protein A2015_09615 [Spirochaetes bacterium GWF1_31_7]OHD74607.1 MAG: hypothetical protein A2355_10500 [Spirochaetes bacterium RIFOXYB1_FULL_32_8]HBD95834.1 DNA-binding response regulator [Spirochaetia bacterium]
MQILVIEDTIRILDNLNAILRQENYIVDSESDGERGYEKALNNNYDLIILDLMLPGMDGFEILEGLRANKKDVPVLILSAKAQVEDKVKALDLGSDDYITKPFAPAELLARIRRIFRQKYDIVTSVIEIGGMKIDINKKVLEIDSTIIDLTSKEYEIIEFLAYNLGKVVSRVTLGEHIWGESLDLFTMSNFIDVHIKNLRKKISDVTDRKYIYTKRGLGFIVSEKEIV